MAVNDELQRVDTVEKTLWDKIVNLAESFTDDDINTLASLIENSEALLALLDDSDATETEQ